MNDYIDRQAAIDAIYALSNYTIAWLESAVDEIKALPSADAVPVVRCKDCKHRYAEDGFCQGRGWPMQLVPDDGFCDKGKRSEE